MVIQNATALEEKMGDQPRTTATLGKDPCDIGDTGVEI